MAQATSVAVVGLGSRGLSVLERIVTLARLAGPAAGEVRVEVIDPDCAGAGVHGTEQPDYLLLNTISGQVSMFPDARTVGAEVDTSGPSLYQWVTQRDLRVADDGFTVGRHGRPVRPTDFLPRRVLGEYLGWFRDQVLSRVPAHVRVVLHRAQALDLAVEPGGGYRLECSDGATVRVGYVFLTTGYTSNVDTVTPGQSTVEGGAAGGARITAPYPLPAQLAPVQPGQVVAIDGFGLSAMDVMSSLTVGRGGRFEPDGDGHRYRPSGREPVLLLYSRSGLPCRARPLVTRFDFEYHPVAFTRASIDALRAARGGPLDFDADVLPLVLAEMRVACRRAQARLAGPAAREDLEDRLMRADGAAACLRALLDELDARHGAFDPLAIFDGSAAMPSTDSAAYQGWFARTLAEDLAQGVLGFAGSPVKAALDILRALRDTVRYTVDFGGLTGDSLDQFTRRTVPMMNRAVVGPQFERHSELLALLAAGLLRVPFGPDPALTWEPEPGRWTIRSTRLARPYAEPADWIVSAQVPPPAVATSGSPLIRSLYRRGLLRPHRAGSPYVLGADVDADQHPRDRDGRADPRIWVLGPLCEGATFYNHLVPSPDTYSRPVHDAHRCVAAMYRDARAPARPALPA